MARLGKLEPHGELAAVVHRNENSLGCEYRMEIIFGIEAKRRIFRRSFVGKAIGFGVPPSPYGL